MLFFFLWLANVHKLITHKVKTNQSVSDSFRSYATPLKYIKTLYIIVHSYIPGYIIYVLKTECCPPPDLFKKDIHTRAVSS